MRRVLGIFLVLFCIPLTALADKDFEFNAKERTISSYIGRTLVGVTRESSKSWSVYLSSTKKAYFKFSSGKSTTATWRIATRNIICFKGLIESNRYKEICKLAKPTGRGLDWKTVKITGAKNGTTYYDQVIKNEHRGSSQIVYSFSGQKYVPQNSYRSNVRTWKGTIVVGRTLKDRETWIAMFKDFGQLDFVFGSGKRYKGRYSLTSNTVCLTFPTRPELNGCRKPTKSKDKILWKSTENGSYISEVVFQTRIQKPVKPKPKADGPTIYKKIPIRDPWMLATHYGSETLAELTRDGRKINLFGTKTRTKLGSMRLPAKTRDIAFSKGGTLLAAVGGKFLTIYDTATGAEQFRYETRFGANLNEVTFAGNRLFVVDAKGALYRFSGANWRTAEYFPVGTTVNGTSLGAGTDMSISPDHSKLVIGFRSGVVRVVDPDFPMSVIRHLKYSSLMQQVAFSPNGKYLAMLNARSGVYFYAVEGDKITYRKREYRSGRTYKSLAFHPTTSEVAIGSSEGIDFVSTVGSQRTTYVPAGKASRQVHYTGVRNSLFFQGLGKDVRILARKKSERTALLNAFSRSLQADKFRRAEFTKAAAERRRIYTERLTAARTHFKNAECDMLYDYPDFFSYVGTPESCYRAANLREAKGRYKDALIVADCAAASALMVEARGKPEDIAACEARVQKRKNTRLLSDALKALDCKTVKTIAAELNNKTVLDECRLKKALASDNPRRLYLQAVKFETSGKPVLARGLYEALMDKFEDDDLALDAADRLFAMQAASQKADAKRKTDQAARLAEQKAERQLALLAQQADLAKEAAERARKDLATQKRKEDARKRKERRLNEIKTALSDLNKKYAFPSGYGWVKTKVNGKCCTSYEISGRLTIKTVAPYPTTAKDYCTVVFDSNVYPRKSKIYTSSNTYISIKSGRSKFEVKFQTGFLNNSGNGFSTDKTRKSTKYSYTKQFRMEFKSGIRKLTNKGDLYTSSYRAGKIQLPPGANIDTFWKDINTFSRKCLLGG